MAVLVKLLEAAAAGTAPDPVEPIDADADRAFFNAALLAAEDAAETARLVLVVAPGQQELSVRRELLDAPHGCLGRVDVALAVEGHELRAAVSTFRNDVPAELPRLDAVFSPLRDELPLGIEDLHAPVRLVRDVEAAVPPGGQAARVVELAVAGAALAPLLEELPGPIG